MDVTEAIQDNKDWNRARKRLLQKYVGLFESTPATDGVGDEKPQKA